MTNLIIIQGDSFPPESPLYTYSVVDIDGRPMDLTGREFRITARPVPVNSAVDPTDTGEDVAFTGTLVIDATGTPTTAENMAVVGDVIDGTFALLLTSETTTALSLDTPFRSDVQMTVRNYWIDQAGNPHDLVRTVTFDDTLTCTSGFTNRFTG